MAVGTIEETNPEKRLAMLTSLSEKASLESKLKLQTDYYTSDEMAKFRKPPKKKAKRRKGADGKDKEDQVGVVAGGAPLPKPVDAGSDEEDPELYEQLSKQRRLVKRSDAGAMRKGEAALAAVSERIGSLGDDEEKKEEREKAILGGAAPKPKEGGEHIAMTATTEFCNVVQTPLEKMDTVKHESFRGSTLYKQQVQQRKGVAAGEKKAKRGLGASVEDIAKAEEDPVVQSLQESELDLSCASGLAYLRARAQIGND